MKIKLQVIALCFVCLFYGELKAQEREFIEVEEFQQKANLLELRADSIKKVIEKLQKVKVSGYIQAQYQRGEKDASSLKVGDSNKEIPKESFDRFGVRRGRIKFAYDEGIALGVFQLDFTEKNISLKDAYLEIKKLYLGNSSLKAGIFDRPFGDEISYASLPHKSVDAPSPERSTVFQTLFPDEKDLGVMLTLQTTKNSSWNFLKLEAGLFAGNGIKAETDSRRDFIGHLSAKKEWDCFKLSGGLSYYNGSVYQGSNKVFTMKDKRFELNDNADNKGKFAKREYFGADVQFTAKSIAGMTRIHGEYLFGQQPGTEASTKSPNSATLLTNDTFIRNFNGGYVMLVQNLGAWPLSAVVKYDWYDPNSKVSGNEVGQNGTTKNDLSFNTVGLGLLWNINSLLKLTAYYDLVNNEKSINIANGEEFNDNVFTLRLQYSFNN